MLGPDQQLRRDAPEPNPKRRKKDVVWFSADQWAENVRLSDIESQFVCTACGKRGADVRPDFAQSFNGFVGV